MTGPDEDEEDVDQDALAAEWGAEAEEDDVDQDDMASEWAAMSDEDDDDAAADGGDEHGVGMPGWGGVGHGDALTPPSDRS